MTLPPRKHSDQLADDPSDQFNCTGTDQRLLRVNQEVKAANQSVPVDCKRLIRWPVTMAHDKCYGTLIVIRGEKSRPATAPKIVNGSISKWGRQSGDNVCFINGDNCVIFLIDIDVLDKALRQAVVKGKFPSFDGSGVGFLEAVAVPWPVDNDQGTTDAPGISGNLNSLQMLIPANSNEAGDPSGTTQSPENDQLNWRHCQSTRQGHHSTGPGNGR